MQGNDRPLETEGTMHGGLGHLFWGSQDLLIRLFPWGLDVIMNGSH